jgi:hypothetical protein
MLQYIYHDRSHALLYGVVYPAPHQDPKEYEETNQASSRVNPITPREITRKVHIQKIPTRIEKRQSHYPFWFTISNTVGHERRQKSVEHMGEGKKDTILGFTCTALLLLDFEQQCTIDMRQYTTEGDCRADKCVKFLVATDRKLQVARRDALNLQVLRSVTGKLEHFGGEVF